MKLSGSPSLLNIFCRFFLRDENRVIGGISFVDSQIEEFPTMDFPDNWNVPLDSNKIRLLKVGDIFADDSAPTDKGA